MSPNYFSDVTNPFNLNKARKQEKSPSQLNQLSQPESASKWGVKELLAFRVLCSKSRDPPALPQDVEKTSFPISAFIRGIPIDNGGLGWREASTMPEINLLLHINKEFEINTTESSACTSPLQLARLWSAIASVYTYTEDKHGNGDHDGDGYSTANSRRSTRSCSQPQRDDMVTPQKQKAEFGLASSPHGPSSSQISASTSDDSFRDESEHTGEAANIQEVYTVRFIGELMRYLLYHLETNDKLVPNGGSSNTEACRVEFDDTQFYHDSRSKDGRLRLRGANDGELVCRNKKRTLKDARIALIEAKTRFYIVNGMDTFPDSVLGQVVGEALAARLRGSIKNDYGM